MAPRWYAGFFDSHDFLQSVHLARFPNYIFVLFTVLEAALASGFVIRNARSSFKDHFTLYKALFAAKSSKQLLPFEER